MLAIMGISGMVAVIGGGLYIYLTVGSLLWGKKLDAGTYTTEVSPLRLPVRPR